MRRAAKVDANQSVIVADLREVGASVTITSHVGEGFPDAVVGFRGINYLMEFKTEDGDLTADQVEWHGAWRGSVHIVRNSEEAFRVIGLDYT